MSKLDIILRTCLNSELELNLKKKNYRRICGSNREELVYNCLISLIQTINNTNFNIHVTILDDNSSEDFLLKVNNLFEACNKPFTIKHLKKRGFNNSAYQQFLLASKCKDLVYTIEDDYLHELNAINHLLGAYSYLQKRFKDDIVLFPFDCPFRYVEGKEEPTMLLYDGIRYWRHTTYTTHTIFAKAEFFKKNFSIFKNLALKYPNVNEDDTINTLYEKKIDNNESNKAKLFSPIPSIAYHLSYQPPTEINTNHLSWKDLWFNDYKINLVHGWFDYYAFYKNIVNNLPNNLTICEIGSWLGKSTIGMALINKKYNKKYKIYAIDTWKGSNETEHKKIINQLKNKNITLYKQFLQNIEIYNVQDNIIPIQKSSMEASLNFKNETVDVVIIDGSHEYKDVLNDIKTWVPKIKKGGLIIGDDFSKTWNGVVKAVTEYFGNNNFNVYGTIWYKIID